jgi:hypothetical protein
MSVKICNLCKQGKAESDYYSTREGSVYGPCRACRRKAGIERYAERKQRAAQNFGKLVSASG